MIELGAHSAKTRFDVPQAFAIGQLSKRHHPEVIRTGEGLDLVIASIAMDAPVKPVPGKVLHELGKNRRADVHCAPGSGFGGIMAGIDSNWKQPILDVTSYSCAYYEQTKIKRWDSTVLE